MRRTDLNRSLLQNTLKTLSELKEVEEVLVISRDPQALTIARNYGARTVREDGQPELNTALKRATVVAQVYATGGGPDPARRSATGHSRRYPDLIERAGEPPVVVIAPDRHGTGTNALLISPSGLIEYDFGENSFQRHCQRAKEAGARLEIVNLPSLGLDLDLPEDLELIRKFELTNNSIIAYTEG